MVASLQFCVVIEIPVSSQKSVFWNMEIYIEFQGHPSLKEMVNQVSQFAKFGCGTVNHIVTQTYLLTSIGIGCQE